MLDRPERIKFETTTYGPEQQSSNDLADLLRPLMSHWLLVAIATAICMAIAVIYLMIAPVRYAATAQMIVDTNRPQSSQ
ncbi:Wzz/FepE/Etk N-terminal domain-containing protein, partial [Vibrio parahaemolyticus]|nr:Wzz/FepE/Etk N-terminal domain-containing protein [Vibrio parahaemolyticus]